jgi:hypothetical protein
VPVETSPSIPFRIRIGITGHRNLPEPEKIRREIVEILSTFFFNAFDAISSIELKSSTAPSIVFTAVSPLAEGADRLLAECVLALPGGRLEVPLPMPIEFYRNDFTAHGSVEQFDALLAKAVRIFSPVCNIDNLQGRERSICYRNAGEETLRRSDIVIAIWDGAPANGMGGTAEIVNLARNQGKPLFIISSTSGNLVETLNAGTLSIKGIIRRIAAFNCHLPSGRAADFSSAEFKKLFELPEAKMIPDIYREATLKHILPYYVQSSSFASLNQKIYQRTGTYAYSISTLSVAFMAIAVVFGTNSPWVATVSYICELAALMFLFMMIHKAQKHQVHKLWLENRALAERLRSTLFFVACGIKPTLCAGDEDDFLQEDWVSRIISEVRDGIPMKELPEPMQVEVFDRFVRAAWIQTQIKYHQNKSNVCGKENQRLKSFGLWLFGSAIAVSAIHLGTALLGMAGHHPGSFIFMLEEILTVVAVTLPAAAAAVGGYRILMEHSRIASRSSAMLRRLSHLNMRSPALSSKADLEKFLVRCEEVMLSESRDWISLMSHADLERIA